LSLKIDFGQRESDNNRYQDRTKKNISMADFTILFADRASKGSDWTEKACMIFRKPCLKISSLQVNTDKIITAIREAYNKKGRKVVINIAGNRESKSPGIECRVETTLTEIFKNIE